MIAKVSNGMVIKEIDKKQFNSSQFIEAISLYRSSFPLNETRPFGKVIEMLKDDTNYQLFVFLDDDSVVGISLMYIFRTLSVALLDYMAVKEEYQRRKIGKKLFDYTFEKFRSAIPNGVGVLMEIQRATDLDPDRNKREDRIRFYMREGAKILDEVDYLIPPIQKGMKPELMYLMIKPIKEIEYLLSKSVIQYITAIYSSIYGYKGSDLLDKISQNLPRRIILRSNRL